MDLLDGDAVFELLEHSFPQAGQGSLRAGRLLWILRGRGGEEMPGALGQREGAGGDGEDALRSAEFPGAGEPTNHLEMATKEMLTTALSEYEGTLLLVSHDRRFLAALSNRVLELTPNASTSNAAVIRNT